MNILGVLNIFRRIQYLGHLVKRYPIRITLADSKTDPGDTVIGFEVDAELYVFDPFSQSGNAL